MFSPAGGHRKPPHRGQEDDAEVQRVDAVGLSQWQQQRHQHYQRRVDLHQRRRSKQE